MRFFLVDEYDFVNAIVHSFEQEREKGRYASPIEIMSLRQTVCINGW